MPKSCWKILPNKITTILGVVADVNLHETEQGTFIEIIVEPQPNPVNYKGEYQYRNGSTKQELKGAVLDKCLLQKQGRFWDSVPIPNVSVTDLMQDIFTSFKEKGIKIGYFESDSDLLFQERIHGNLFEQGTKHGNN